MSIEEKLSKVVLIKTHLDDIDEVDLPIIRINITLTKIGGFHAYGIEISDNSHPIAKKSFEIILAELRKMKKELEEELTGMFR